MIGLSVDVDINLDGLAAATDEIKDQIQRKVAFELYSELIQTTPVDTGRARAGWSMDVKHGSFVPPVKDGGMIYRLQNPTTPVKAPWIIIYNNVEYIVGLNEGHSKQAPKRFVERAAEKVKRGFA